MEHDVPELLPAARRPVVHVRRPVRQQPRLQLHAASSPVDERGKKAEQMTDRSWQKRRTHADERKVDGRRLHRRLRIGGGGGGVRLDGADSAEPPPLPLLLGQMDRAVLLLVAAAAAGRSWMGRGGAE